MSLQYNVKDGTGAQRFITPKVVIKAGGKEVTAKSEVALDLAYIVKAVCDADFTGVTTSGAVAHVGKVVLSMAKDTQYSVYMPSTYEARESDDLTKWTKCVTVGQEVISKAVTLVSDVEKVLSSARDAMSKAQAEADAITNKAGIVIPAHDQPSYFAGGTAKRGNGKKEVTSLF